MLQNPTQKYNVVKHWIWLQDCETLMENTAILETVSLETGLMTNTFYV